MSGRPIVLTINIGEDGTTGAMLDDGSYSVGQKKTSYTLDRRRVDQLIERQYNAIRANDIKEAEQIGSILMQFLLPREIRESLPKDGEALLLSTNEHNIPWELLWDRAFLGVRYAMGRQMITDSEVRISKRGKDEGQKTCLILTNPTEDLPEAQSEALQLMQYFRGRGIACTLVAGKQITSADILMRMGMAEYDIIHYSGHIDIDEDGASLRLSGDDCFYLKETLRLDDFGHPFIFLNGCGGGPAWGSSTDIVAPLVYAGSGPILCATMPISDKGSRLFSESIIANVLEGMPYGQATMQARRKFCFDPGAALDWMCFAYYGNPLDGMTIGIQQEQDRDILPKKKQAPPPMQPSPLSAGRAGEFSTRLNTVLGRADSLTGDVYIISTSHLFASLLMEEDADIARAFKRIQVDSDVIQVILALLFPVLPAPELRPVPPWERYSENAQKAVERARTLSMAAMREALPKDLFATLLSQPCMLTEILGSLDVDCNQLIEGLDE